MRGVVTVRGGNAREGYRRRRRHLHGAVLGAAIVAAPLGHLDSSVNAESISAFLGSME